MMVFQDYSRASGSHRLSLTRKKQCAERGEAVRIRILTTVPFLEANLLPRSKFAKDYALARKTLLIRKRRYTDCGLVVMEPSHI